jgi:hypothetical protein
VPCSHRRVVLAVSQTDTVEVLLSHEHATGVADVPPGAAKHRPLCRVSAVMTRTGSKGGALFVRLLQEQFGCALLLLRAEGMLY